jgi:diaminopimelate epimerase
MDMPNIFFTKAVALGNDFVILDLRDDFISLTAEQVRLMSNRRQGVGCDQLILILPPTNPKAYIRLKFYNADGSEAEACGNGTRCVARFMMENEDIDDLFIQTTETLCHASWANREETMVSLTLGNPCFDWGQIPLASPEALAEVSYQAISPFCVNVGNPHAVFFVTDVDKVPLADIGPQIESHRAFPERVNVGFAQIMNEETLKLRVWERGSGYTMACGTGACAAAVAAIRQQFVPSGRSPLRVIQEGGDLLIHWQEGDPVTMIGCAQITFQGEVKV